VWPPCSEALSPRAAIQGRPYENLPFVPSFSLLSPAGWARAGEEAGEVRARGACNILLSE
jgi:hypothetical protein